MEVGVEDPGSSALKTPESGIRIRDGQKSGSGMDKNPDPA
jgi:hypothetical protein